MRTLYTAFRIQLCVKAFEADGVCCSVTCRICANQPTDYVSSVCCDSSQSLHKWFISLVYQSRCRCHWATGIHNMTQTALNNRCQGVVTTFQFCCTVAASTLAPHTSKCCMQDDATEAEWYDVTKLPSLAFDHKLIVRTAFQHLLKQPEATSTGTGNRPVALSAYLCSIV